MAHEYHSCDLLGGYDHQGLLQLQFGVPPHPQWMRLLSACCPPGSQSSQYRLALEPSAVIERLTGVMLVHVSLFCVVLTTHESNGVSLPSS